MKFDFDLTSFMQTQQKKNNRIVSCGFDSRGAWEGCTGSKLFADGTQICISDEVHVFNKDKVEVEMLWE